MDSLKMDPLKMDSLKMNSLKMDPLKLVAFDKDDIEIVSAHVQDAVLKVADIHWLATDHRLVLGLNRFDWEEVQFGAPSFHRRRTALRFDRVRALKSRHLQPSERDAVLNLLAVDYSEGAGGGIVTLTFSDGAALRLEVECLECELVDLGPNWETACCPCHADDPVSEPPLRG